MVGRGGGELETFLGELGADKRVDGISLFLILRKGGTLERGVGPMRLVDGALGDPAAEEFLLRGREGFVCLLRRHRIFLVEDAEDDFAFVRVSGYDGEGSFLGLADCLFAHIEPQAGFAGFRIEAVAVEARVRQDRPDVAVEAHGLRRGGDGWEKQGKREKGGSHETGQHQYERIRPDRNLPKDAKEPVRIAIVGQ